MAKGDDQRLRNAIDYSTAFAQGRLDNTQRILDRQNLQFEQNYNAGVARNLNDYDSIMGQYRTLLSGAPMGGNPYQNNIPGAGYVPPQGSGNPAAPQIDPTLIGAPHATNPNNAPPIGTAIPRGTLQPGAPSSGITPSGPGNVPASTTATQPPATGAAQFIKNWQATHSPSEGKGPLLAALQANGFNATDYKYGDVSSGNELTIDGQKYKVLGGENSANPFWYEAGTDDSAPGSQYPGGGQGSLVNPLAGYSNFAQTGGFSPRDIQNIRAQSIAPIRGLVESGRQEVQRQGKMGNAPNKVAALAKMSREGAYATSDATTNAEANIARLIQQGKLSGLSGLQQGILGAMQGMTGLYGSTPGMASTFGNQVLSSTNQQLYGNQLENDIQKMRLQAMEPLLQAPGQTSSALANVRNWLDIISKGATAASGIGDLGKTGNSGSTGNRITEFLKKMAGLAPFGGGGIGPDYGPGQEPTYNGGDSGYRLGYPTDGGFSNIGRTPVTPGHFDPMGNWVPDWGSNTQRSWGLPWGSSGPPENPNHD